MAMSSLSLLDSEESLPSVYIIASLSSANLRLWLAAIFLFKSVTCILYIAKNLIAHSASPVTCDCSYTTHATRYRNLKLLNVLRSRCSSATSSKDVCWICFVLVSTNLEIEMAESTILTKSMQNQILLWWDPHNLTDNASLSNGLGYIQQLHTSPCWFTTWFLIIVEVYQEYIMVYHGYTSVSVFEVHVWLHWDINMYVLHNLGIHAICRSCCTIWGFPDCATICRLSCVLQILQQWLGRSCNDDYTTCKPCNSGYAICRFSSYSGKECSDLQKNVQIQRSLHWIPQDLQIA